MGLSTFAAGYDNVVCDMDGCLWIGDELTPRAAEAVAAIRQAGKGLCFVTNNPRRGAEDYVAKMWRLGLQASPSDVVTVGGATQHLLAETRQGKTAFVIGTETLRKHVTDAGLKVLNGTDLATRAEVVVVGGTEGWTFEDVRVAAMAARRNGDLVATSLDPTYPMPHRPCPGAARRHPPCPLPAGLWPGTGAVVRAVEIASDRTAVVVGKPEPQLIISALDRLGDGRALMIGDRLDADVAAAAKAHIDAALVLTGGATREQAAAAPEPKPVAVADTLAELVLG